MAGGVCDQDPRTHRQRRADALGALAAGADRLACRCGRSDCPVGATPEAEPAGGTAGPRASVVIHVLAEQAGLDGTSTDPAVLLESGALIPPELPAELAATAKLRPLLVPVDAAPEVGYRPSVALAEFVRCRDLTCRFPGCDVPASGCDVEHTIPYGAGGQTHASNLGSVCRKKRNPGDVARPVIVPGSSSAKSMERSEHVKRTGRSASATLGG